jgi:D-alanyl-D-alanine carboxypeptidase
MNGMRAARAVVVLFALVITACSPSAQPGSTGTAAPSGSAAAPRYSLGHFPEPEPGSLPDQTVAALQAILDAAVDHGLPGISATVMAADRGVWTGVAGTADGNQPLKPGAHFGIASLTKSVVATEVMSLSETGRLRLDDPVSTHLPKGFDFDTNGATIENLLAMESGIPDPTMTRAQAVADPGRIWDPTEILATVPDLRSKPGHHFVYEDSNYMLLGLVIEEVTGMSVAATLRGDVLAGPRLSALVYQPEERPAGPLALPFGGRDGLEAFERGGGYLPSAADTSWGNGSGCMASDSATLALFGYLLFGGSLVSDPSLVAMTDFGTGADYDRYGLGVFEQTQLARGFPVQSVGNGGWEEGGYSSVLAVLPSEGVAIAVMTNTAGDPVELVIPVAQDLAAVLAR